MAEGGNDDITGEPAGPATVATGDDLRIVSLLPSLTDIVAELGLAERVVGVTHECDNGLVLKGAGKGPVVVTESFIDPKAEQTPPPPQKNSDFSRENFPVRYFQLFPNCGVTEETPSESLGLLQLKRMSVERRRRGPTESERRTKELRVLACVADSCSGAGSPVSCARPTFTSSSACCLPARRNRFGRVEVE